MRTGGGPVLINCLSPAEEPGSVRGSFLCRYRGLSPFGESQKGACWPLRQPIQIRRWPARWFSRLRSGSSALALDAPDPHDDKLTTLPVGLGLPLGNRGRCAQLAPVIEYGQRQPVLFRRHAGLGERGREAAKPIATSNPSAVPTEVGACRRRAQHILRFRRGSRSGRPPSGARSPRGPN